jgi:hypothetical protein
MDDQTEIPQQRVVRIGPDQVTITAQKLIIEAKYEMPEWDVRSSRPPAIYFEDKKYLLVEKTELKGKYAFRYVLHPWPEGRASNPNMFFDYNAEAVAERDVDRRGEISGDIIRTILLPFYPILGWCWSGTQQRMVRFGFVPRSLTGISIFASFALGFAQAVITSVMLNGSARSGKMMIGGAVTAFSGHNYVTFGSVQFPLGILDAVILLALIADALMRYTHYLREDQWTGGFLEWLISKKAKKD